MTVEEGDHAVVQKIGRRDRRLAIIELGASNLDIGVDKGLLVDTADAFQRAHIEGVLCAAIAGTFGFELTLHLFLGFGLLERGELALGEDEAFLRHLRLERLQSVFHSCEVVPPPDRADAACSMAMATMASSISGATRFFRMGLRREISCRASSPLLS